MRIRPIILCTSAVLLIAARDLPIVPAGEPTVGEIAAADPAPAAPDVAALDFDQPPLETAEAPAEAGEEDAVVEPTVETTDVAAAAEPTEAGIGPAEADAGPLVEAPEAPVAEADITADIPGDGPDQALTAAADEPQSDALDDEVIPAEPTEATTDEAVSEEAGVDLASEIAGETPPTEEDAPAVAATTETGAAVPATGEPPSRAFMVGVWAEDLAKCSSALDFKADGTLIGPFPGWQLDDGVLTMTGNRQKIWLTVIDKDTMESRRSETDPPRTLLRCPSGPGAASDGGQAFGPS